MTHTEITNNADNNLKAITKTIPSLNKGCCR